MQHIPGTHVGEWRDGLPDQTSPAFGPVSQRPKSKASVPGVGHSVWLIRVLPATTPRATVSQQLSQ